MIGKIKDIVQKNRDVCIWGTGALILILAMVFMVKVDLSSKILKFTSHKSNQDEVQIVHDFTSGMEIRQIFECYEDFDFITLNFSDHDQRLQGKVAIQILDADEGEPLIYQELDATSIYYNVPVEVHFDNIGGGEVEKQYEVILKSFDTRDTALGVFGYKTGEKKAIINGDESEYALSIGIHSYTDLYSEITMLILGVSCFSIFIVIFAVFKMKFKEEHIFLVIAIPFATCMLLLWPGNAVYDEARHVNTVYHYSNVILGCAEKDTMTEIQMRKCDVMDKADLKTQGTTINAQAQNYWYYVDKMWDKAEDKSIVLVDVSQSPVVTDGSIVQYIPGVLGMTLGRILQLNYFGIMTLCRITIMGFYLLMCYYAIKKIPILKMMAVFWAALPMNLYQASGVSYDSFTFAVGIVVFAFIIKLWNEGLDKKDWIRLGIAVFALGQCKGGVYLSLILLMCFISKEKYNGKKWLKFGSILGVAGVSMISSFLPTIISWFVRPIVSETTSQASEVINSGGVIAEKLHPFFVLENPISFIRMFVETIIINLDVYLGQMLGYRTAWSNEAIALVIMLPFMVLLILTVVKCESDNFEIGVIARLGILGIVLLEFVGMQAIFLVETPTYSDVIIGFQGRYFILFIPCILLLFRNNGLIFKEKQEYLYPCFSMAQLVYLYFFLKIFMKA